MRKLIHKLLQEPTRERLEQLRIEYRRGHKHTPSNIELLAACTPEERKQLPVLRKKPTRSLSGISVVAVMNRPAKCPGKCLYCPTSEIAPKSYTGYEPAALRARSHGFDPCKQVRARVADLETAGHPTDKVELIVMGGTFPAESKAYQARFVKRCFDALNGKDSRTLPEAHRKNEQARHRCTGLTFETRPDYCGKQEVGLMLKLGVTRVELGAQSLDDEILAGVRRGHKVRSTALATRLLKEVGQKVAYHMMPGLPGASRKKDLQMFKRLFSDQQFRPDMLKIYPCLVVPGSELHKIWEKGEYEPYTTEEIVDLIATATKYFPPYLRIMRMQRDIPLNRVAAGPDKTNITELVNERLAEEGKSCPCIRCREAGHRQAGKLRLEMTRMKYRASGGTEYWLAYEDASKDTLAAFLRLRIGDIPVVRELRVYGQQIPIGERGGALQHKGLGAGLLREAEGMVGGELYVLSAVGTRPYYRKLGYRRRGAYMAIS